MIIEDASIIKGIEVHTIMGSEGYVVMNGRTRIFSVSPHHVSLFSIGDSAGHGVFGDRFFVTSGGGYDSPYWKAKKWIKLYIEDGNLIVSTDHGVGSMEPVEKFPVLPEPPSSLKPVDLHRKKVELSKLLGTKNYKRPRVSMKYVDASSIFEWLPKNTFVKSSTLLQVLEVAWRVKKVGKVGLRGDKLYVLVSSGYYGYEAFVAVV